MKAFLLVVLLSTLLAATLASPQDILKIRAGQEVSTAFLSRLADPASQSYQVSIVSAAYAIGVSPMGAPVEVEYIRGRDGLLWEAAARQLEDANSESFRFSLVRKTVNAEDCLQLDAAVSAFYSELESHLAVPVALTGPPAELESDVFVTDSPEILIHVAVTGGVLTVRPRGSSRAPLHVLSTRLLSVVSACSNDAAGSAEERHF